MAGRIITEESANNGCCWCLFHLPLSVETNDMFYILVILIENLILIYQITYIFLSKLIAQSSPMRIATVHPQEGNRFHAF